MNKNGVCVFDIDNTLTCNGECSINQIENMKNSIRLCNENNMGVAINTARPPQNDVLFGINADVRRLLKYVNVYTRPRNGISVELQKLEHMNTIANEHNVNVNKTILIDDRLSSCRFLEQNNVSTIYVSGENGITTNEYEKLKEKIKYIKHM